MISRICASVCDFLVLIFSFLKTKKKEEYLKWKEFLAWIEGFHVCQEIFLLFLFFSFSLSESRKDVHWKFQFLSFCMNLVQIARDVSFWCCKEISSSRNLIDRFLKKYSLCCEIEFLWVLWILFRSPVFKLEIFFQFELMKMSKCWSLISHKELNVNVECFLRDKYFK